MQHDEQVRNFSESTFSPGSISSPNHPPFSIITPSFVLSLTYAPADTQPSPLTRGPGDDSSWRMASIQPVPIPDLSHTGIRTKFSPGAGNGFTPDGNMTSTFRTSIHETMCGLPGESLGDSRDMRTRDYARAIRNHKVDPCGGPLLHAHMSSLELGLAPGAGTAASTMASTTSHEGASIRRSALLGDFRGRLSPPSSPPSNRRALVSCGSGRAGVDVGNSSGGGGGVAPIDTRQALLLREFRGVRLASAVVASVGTDREGGDPRFGCTKSGVMPPRTVKTPAVSASISGCRGGRARNEGGADPDLDASRQRGVLEVVRSGTPSNAEKQRTRAGVDADGRGVVSSLQEYEGPESEAGVAIAKSLGDGEASFDGDEAWQQERGRGSRRRGRRGRGGGMPQASDSFEGGRGRRPSEGRALQASASSPSLARRRSLGKRSARSTRLKKPFSSDSLFACLLDVHYGNTRDLSPDKMPGRKWNLQDLPARFATSVAAPRGWDGFASEDTDGDDAEGTNARARRGPRLISQIKEDLAEAGGGEGDTNRTEEDTT